MFYYYFGIEKVNLLSMSCVYIYIENRFPLQFQSILSGFALMNITNHCWAALGQPLLFTDSMFFFFPLFFLFLFQRKKKREWERKKKRTNRVRISGKPQWLLIASQNVFSHLFQWLMCAHCLCFAFFIAWQLFLLCNRQTPHLSPFYTLRNWLPGEH